ncbi:OLC1v1029395C1 [Oldenlandia corymbosa var. corymbosa]|uniref:OLC1v1029395C1 n=1 Tax=Oldenlandia corymbosa var. corymbosa TaxID=529605 RepID=A0AAV1CE97_OLDCO|nr:OLC1v1029395C1 [Oldenlandia corymbosa var. corymbosa]
MEFNNMEAFLAVSILIVSIFWYLTVIFKKREKTLLPPGPWGLPIVGYLPFLTPNLHTQFTELAHRYGPIFKLKLGNKLCVVLSSSSLVKEVTRDQDVTFGNRDPPAAAEAITYGGFDIAWCPYGTYWRNMRKVFIREMLSGSNLDACYDLRKDEVIKAIEYVGMRVGKPVEVGNLAFLTEMNVVLSMLWGKTLDSRQQLETGTSFRQVFGKMMDLFAKPNVSDFYPSLRRFDIQGIEREAKSLLQTTDEIFDAAFHKRMKMAEDGMKSDGNKKDFVQILLEIKKFEDTGEEISLTQKKAILLDIVIGGTDTTSTMIEWAMTEIVHHKEVLEKIQKELDHVIGPIGTVDESHLPELHYLDAAVKETFRLHHALPFLVPRRPSKSCILDGYTIPKDARVLINAWAIQRDPELWDDPLEFKPERFLIEPKKWDFSGNNFQFIPFGSGRRICPGIPLAEKMIKYLLASFLYSFDWKPTKTKEDDLSEKSGIVMRKSDPLSAIPIKRTRNQLD